MPYPSAPDDLALHGVRVLGFATASRVADRFVLDAAATEEYLLDFEAFGWVRRDSFAGSKNTGSSASNAARTSVAQSPRGCASR